MADLTSSREGPPASPSCLSSIIMNNSYTYISQDLGLVSRGPPPPCGLSVGSSLSVTKYPSQMVPSSFSKPLTKAPAPPCPRHLEATQGDLHPTLHAHPTPVLERLSSGPAPSRDTPLHSRGLGETAPNHCLTALSLQSSSHSLSLSTVGKHAGTSPVLKIKPASCQPLPVPPRPDAQLPFLEHHHP